MSPSSYLARAEHIAARRLGDETMIMSGLDSSLFSLNATATALWEAADGATPLKDIVERHICSRYEVDADEAMRDALECAEGLARHGLLRVSDSQMVESSP